LTISCVSGLFELLTTQDDERPRPSPELHNSGNLLVMTDVRRNMALAKEKNPNAYKLWSQSDDDALVEWNETSSMQTDQTIRNCGASGQTTNRDIWALV